MKIQVQVKRERYRFLWLKFVKGFDATQHCARCLKGAYHPMLAFPRGGRVEVQMAEADLDPEGAPYFYLCGVTPVYAENLHLPFRFCPGGRVMYEDANVCIQIEDAEQLDILPLPDAVLNSERYGDRFTTCRNFQFGWRAFSEPLKW